MTHMGPNTRPPRSRYAFCRGYEIHVTEWGDPAHETVVMWHGLARTGRDFDTLARSLADTYHIIAPDTLGRGLSAWSKHPDDEYCLGFYAAIATDLLDHFDLHRVRWVGTSMGGALGIRLAGGLFRDRISHLVINDIAPQLAAPAIERILAYAGAPPQFDTVTELEQFLRTAYRPYGWLSDAEWRSMAETSARRTDGGRVTVHYDPKMVRQFVCHPTDYDQWPLYDAITARTLLLRGKESDLILPEWAQEMGRRGPQAQVVEIDGVGHAPALNVPDQISLIRRFLAS